MSVYSEMGARLAVRLAVNGEPHAIQRAAETAVAGAGKGDAHL